jgi:Mg-chelatase subunit ChlD
MNKLAIAVVLGSFALGWAQSATTGAVIALAKDPAGKGLAGVTVTVTSPALGGQAQSCFTDEVGTCKIVELPPGDYLATFFYLDITIQQKGLHVRVDRTATVVQTIDESKAKGEKIVVEARAPLIDATTTRRGITLSKEYLKNIPVPGRTFDAALGAAAGKQKDGYGTSFSGSTSLEKHYVTGRPGLGTTGPAPKRVAAAPAPQQLDVRAGEWDDNANYRDYVRWLGQQPRGIARLDVADRQFVVVLDRDGKAVPNCAIAIAGKTATAHLTTMASGRALLFPRAVGLDGDRFEARATCGNATARASGRLGRTDGIVELRVGEARELAARRDVDLAFVLDTTGSMAEEIDAVKSTIGAVAARLANDQTSVRIGLVEYRDRGDDPVTKVYPFATDLKAFASRVAELHAAGGGDYPEDMHAGLAAALDRLAWRDTAVARVIVVIGDAPPHLDYQDEEDYAAIARRAAARGIKLFTVSASGMDLTGQIVMRQMAQYTGATNLFVLRGGAGPQSVGGGDPESSCGGTHEQYASGNLDQLVVGKIRRELALVDADPRLIPGVGKDESAKPCNQRVVLAR